MLDPIDIPGLFITGTDTGVGKTVIAGAIASWFNRRQARIAVCKPVATGCIRRWEGLVSEDAEYLASCADARHSLDIICPQRYVEPLAPAIAAARARQPLDWSAVQRSLNLMTPSSDVMIIEGVGGLMVPLDERSAVIDVMMWLQLPAVIVARPGLGTINHTLLTIAALRSAGITIAGVVINRYATDNVPIADENNPRAIEHWGRVPVLCLAPDEPVRGNSVPVGIADAIDQVDWARLAAMKRGRLR